MVRAYRDALPLVALSLEESGTSELVEALVHAAARCRLRALADRSGFRDRGAFHSGRTDGRGASGRLALAVARTRHPLPLAALAGEIFILYRRPLGPGLYDAIIAACQRAGYSPNIGQEAPRMLATLSLVAAGLGVTLVPQSMRRLRVHGVIYRTVDSAAGLVAPLNLAYRRSETSPAARRFTALVRARLDHPEASRPEA